MSNDVVRYNITQNNGSQGNFYAEITTGGGTLTGFQIYNNDFYASTGSFACAQIDGPLVNSGFRNNILFSTNSVPLVTIASATFQGNDYWTSSGATNIAGYTTLSAWQTATGQEKLNSNSVAYAVDPLFTAPGGGGTIGYQGNLTTLGAYHLRAGSPLLDAGLNLPVLFGLNVGAQDFYGDTIPEGTGYPIGADDSVPPTLPFIITSITLNGNDVNLVWNGSLGSNVVQVSSGTSSAGYTNNFVDLATAVLPGATVTNYTDHGGATNGPSRFYRIDLRQ